MNDKQRESLSAFLDGELNDPEAIEALVRQSGCNKAFASLCEQRDATQGQINSCLPVNFAEQVAKAVANEPTILSPAATRVDAPVIEQERKGEVIEGWFGSRAANMAIAASVAALGFVGLVTFNGNSDNGAMLASSPVSTTPNIASSSIVGAPALSVRQDAVRQVTSDVRSIDFNSLSPQLRNQLIQHMEAARRAQQSEAKPSNISYQPGS